MNYLKKMFKTWQFVAWKMICKTILTLPSVAKLYNNWILMIFSKLIDLVKRIYCPIKIISESSDREPRGGRGGGGEVLFFYASLNTFWLNLLLLLLTVTISPTFYEQLFGTKVFCADFMYLHLCLYILENKNFSWCAKSIVKA